MRRSLRRVLGAIIVAALGGAAGLVSLAWQDTSAGAALTDMDGRAVILDMTPDLAAADLRATGGRFQVPSLGLDVPLLEMTVADGVLNPPTLTDAFVIRDPDRTPGHASRPTIVAMHAVRDGRAPGNAFFEPGAVNPSVTVIPGHELRVDGVVYSIVDTEALPKADAARSPDIWGRHPDGDRRLVVVTCLQRQGGAGPASENLVVHAVRA